MKRQDRSPLEKQQMDEFARRLYQAMRSKDMKASDLARRVWGNAADGTARNRDRISVYLNAKALPEAANLEAIAKALDVAPTDLLPAAKPPAGEHPEVEITAVPGEPGMAVLVVQKKVTLAVAAEIAMILAGTTQKV